MANSKTFKGLGNTDTQVRMRPENNAIGVMVLFKEDGKLKRYEASIGATRAEEMGMTLIGYAARLREAKGGRA